MLIWENLMEKLLIFICQFFIIFGYPTFTQRSNELDVWMIFSHEFIQEIFLLNDWGKSLLFQNSWLLHPSLLHFIPVETQMITRDFVYFDFSYSFFGSLKSFGIYEKCSHF